MALFGLFGKKHEDEHDTSDSTIFDDDYEEEYDDDEEESFSSCYSWCGNPAYPDCVDSCKLHDD